MSQSRYATVGTLTLTTADGRQIRYLARRLLPAVPPSPAGRVHRVTGDERIDLIAQQELGDPELSWLIADANLVMRPGELERPGDTISIPGPAVPGMPAHG